MDGFHRRGPEIDLDMPEEEVGLLLLALPLLAAASSEDPGGPGGRLLRYRAHPGDEAAEERFRRLTAGSLAADRAADRDRFAASLHRGTLSAHDAGSWLRVLAEARLVLAGRLGMDREGEEQPAADSGPVAALLHLFGSVQDELVGLLLGDP